MPTSDQSGTVVASAPLFIGTKNELRRIQGKINGRSKGKLV